MAIASVERLRASAGPLTEARVKLAKALSADRDLFLSHSHVNSNLVGPTVEFLEKYGARVYVDLQDAGIKGLSELEIAARVRQAVQLCGRLVVLVTEQTTASRWIPWEMGLADGMAGAGQVALLPLERNPVTAGSWVNQKYFELYPRIEWELLTGESTHRWVVRDPKDGRFWRLERWMTLTKRPPRNLR